MKVQSFMGKVTNEGLHQMDQHVNTWLKRHQVKPVHVKQSFGSERFHDGRNQESIIVITLWYEEDPEKDDFGL